MRGQVELVVDLNATDNELQRACVARVTFSVIGPLWLTECALAASYLDLGFGGAGGLVDLDLFNTHVHNLLWRIVDDTQAEPLTLCTSVSVSVERTVLV